MVTASLAALDSHLLLALLRVIYAPTASATRIISVNFVTKLLPLISKANVMAGFRIKLILSLCVTVKMVMEPFWITMDGIVRGQIANNVKNQLVPLDLNQKNTINHRKQLKWVNQIVPMNARQTATVVMAS